MVKMPEVKVKVWLTITFAPACKLVAALLKVFVVRYPVNEKIAPAPRVTPDTLIVPAPDKVPDVSVNVFAELDNAPETFKTAEALFIVTLLSMFTLIPEGIIMISVVGLKEGAAPPQVVELLQLPESTAVNVAL